MQCPACDRDLVSMTAGPVTVDTCRDGCGGIWFGPGELHRLDEEHESAGVEVLSAIQPPAAESARQGRRHCPTCDDVVMMQHYTSAKRQVVVDECPGCGGFWLDLGELARIRDEHATEDERKRAAQALFSEMFDPQLTAMEADTQARLQRTRNVTRVLKFFHPRSWWWR
jgi:uncharacterized protein